MEYIFLGTGSCVPNSYRKSSGALLNINDKLILIDCGTGILHSIPESGYNYCNIDIICITHLHIDHINDFAALLFAFRNDPDCLRKKTLIILAPVGFTDYLNKLRELYGDTIDSENYNIEIKESDNTSFQINDMTIKTFSTKHLENSIGYRFEYNDKVLAVTGDTGYCKNAIKICRNADLAVLECSFPEEICIDTHLSPASSGQLAEKAGVKELLLTHLYPIVEKSPIIRLCKKYYSGNVKIAQNLKKYSI